MNLKSRNQDNHKQSWFRQLKMQTPDRTLVNIERITRYFRELLQLLEKNKVEEIEVDIVKMLAEVTGSAGVA